MAGAPKYLEALEALWWRSRGMRKKALGGELVQKELEHLPPELRDRPLSLEEYQSLPPQLRLPVELHGFRRPKELRGPALIKWLMLLDGIWQDRRFGNCINAFLEHGIVDPHTHEFITDKDPNSIGITNTSRPNALKRCAPASSRANRSYGRP
jgi:hypothetical protein